ncbi:MAG: 23S rRNA (guanosine(2251)-2'-O)-methyltransferase RlmB [Syntrophobacterales bacterium]|jgi:23S rRNA (guanosine2251-2'-O)-methyltransferase
MTDEILYGINPIREALISRGHKVREIWVGRRKASTALREILDQARGLGIKVRTMDRRRLDLKAGTAHHQGILAFLSPYDYVDLKIILKAAHGEGAALIVVLDGIEDPQNLGALIRTAYVCGAHGVVVPKDRAAQLTASVAKASAGALEYTKVARVTNLRRTLELLKDQGVWVVGLTMEGDKPIYELDLCQPIALVIGGEAKGIRPLIKQTCDLQAYIPQRGRLDSLNAAAAGAMALYETMRQRLTAAPQK